MINIMNTYKTIMILDMKVTIINDSANHLSCKQRALHKKIVAGH